MELGSRSAFPKNTLALKSPALERASWPQVAGNHAQRDERGLTLLVLISGKQKGVKTGQKADNHTSHFNHFKCIENFQQRVRKLVWTRSYKSF